MCLELVEDHFTKIRPVGPHNGPFLLHLQCDVHIACTRKYTCTQSHTTHTLARMWQVRGQAHVYMHVQANEQHTHTHTRHVRDGRGLAQKQKCVFGSTDLLFVFRLMEYSNKIFQLCSSFRMCCKRCGLFFIFLVSYYVLYVTHKRKTLLLVSAIIHWDNQTMSSVCKQP